MDQEPDVRPAKKLSRGRAALVAVTVGVLAILVFLPACCCVPRRSASTAVLPQPIPLIGKIDFPLPTEAAARAPTQTQMSHVWFRLDPILFLDIHSLRGEMESKEAGTPVNFDNKTAFVMRVDHAVIGMTPGSLERLMNGYVFAYPNPPLRDLHISIDGHQLRQEGVMHKLVDIPFTMWADVSASDGLIRIHPTKIDICGINGLGLLKAVGMTLQKMLPMPVDRGIRAEKNDLLIDPERVLPPPRVTLHLVDVRVADGELIQTYDSGRHLPPLAVPHGGEPAYMYFQHGTLRMGKLLMIDADMQVVGTTGKAPFDFFIDDYNRQLAEGFTRNQADYGLLVFMRNYGDLGKPAEAGERLAPGGRR